MPSPEAEAFFLRHGPTPYDPVKAREYYLRTRQLKGRQTSEGDEPTKGRSSSVARYSSPRKKSAAEKTPAQRQKDIEVRVGQLKDRLAKLRKVLTDLTKQVKSNSEDSPQPSKASSDRKLTGSQKAEARKRSKEYYEKNKKDDPASNDTKALEEKIQDVMSKIEEARIKLKESRSA